MRILVVHANAWHVGYVGCYGCDWVATPNLDRLAVEGVVFDRHIADRPVLQDDRPGYFTGRLEFPQPSGQVSPDDSPLLPEILRRHGIEPLILKPSLSSKEMLREVKRWARGNDRFCWINWPSLAPPWDVSEEFLEPYFSTDEEEPLAPWLDPPIGPFDETGCDRERLQSTYAGVVTAFDTDLGAVLEQVDAKGDILLCVTSSSGLALGEHGFIGAHRAWLHAELVHVPLIVRLPGSAEAGLRVSALTQPMDLVPTILAALQLPAVESHGMDLLPLIREETDQVRLHACSGLAIGDSIEWSLRTSEWAFLLPLATPPDDAPRGPQLFVKPDDRWEVNDVRQHYLELAEQLEQDLRSFVARVVTR